MKTPDHTQSYPQIGEVRFYNDGGLWRYVHGGGEGSGLKSLEAAQAEVQQFLSADSDQDQSPSA